MKPVMPLCVVAGLILVSGACRGSAADAPRASGYVEATEVRVAAEAGGRVLEMNADEGRRVAVGDVLARIDTGEVEIVLRRAEADRVESRDSAAPDPALEPPGIRSARRGLRGMP